jgi:choice-of-anchor C domain-containing protein
MKRLRQALMAVLVVLAALAFLAPAAVADDDDDDGGGGAVACGPNIVANGDFEVPVVPGPFVTYPTGFNFGGWMVTSGTIDHIGTHWQAASLRQSVDLSGLTPGTIRQDIATMPGERYILRFAMAGNPDGPPTVKQMEVRFGGAVVDQPTFSTSGTSRTAMGWVYLDYVVQATTALSALEFQSLTNTPFGPALDDVSLCQILDDDDDDDDGGDDDDDDEDDG